MGRNRRLYNDRRVTKSTILVLLISSLIICAIGLKSEVFAEDPIVCQIGLTGYTSLEDAVVASNDGDEIEIIVSSCDIPNTITVSNKNITITGAEGKSTILATASSMAMFQVDADGGINFVNCDIDGYGQTNIRAGNINGTLNTDTCKVKNFDDSAFVVNGGSAAFDGDTVISSCKSTGRGVIDASNSASLSFMGNTLLKKNTSTGEESAPIACHGTSNRIIITPYAAMMDNKSTSTDANSASGIFISSGSSVTMTGGTISSNKTTGLDSIPGVYAEAGSKVNVSGNVVITENGTDDREKNVAVFDKTTITMNGELKPGSAIGVTAPYMNRDDEFGIRTSDSYKSAGFFYQDKNNQGQNDLFGMPEGTSLIKWGSCSIKITKEVGPGVSTTDPFDFRIRAFDPGSYYQVTFSILQDMLQDSSSIAYNYYYTQNKQGQLDSTGKNYGLKIKADLIEEWPSLANVDFYFSMNKYYSGGSYDKDKYRYIFADTDPGVVQVGDIVPIFVYDSGTEEYMRALGLVSEKNLEGTMFKYISTIQPGSETVVKPLANVDKVISISPGGESETFGPFPYGTLLYNIKELDGIYLTQITVNEDGVDTSSIIDKQISKDLTSNMSLDFLNLNPAKVSLSATKTVEGEKPGDLEFPFKSLLVYAKSGGKVLDVSKDFSSYIDTTNAMTTKNDAEGKVEFGDIDVKKPGTYIFKISEAMTGEQSLQYQCENDAYYAKVTGTEEELLDGTPNVTYYKNWDQTDESGLSNPIAESGVVFNNVYRYYPLVVEKKVDGENTDTDKDFTFHLSVQEPLYKDSELVTENLLKMLSDKTYLKGTETTNRAYQYYYGRSSSYNSGASQQLDSTGTNYGKPISAQLETVIPGLTSGNYSWTISRTVMDNATHNFNKEEFDLYFSEIDISQLPIGSYVRVDRYNTTTKQYTAGTAKLEKNNSGFTVFDISSFQSNSMVCEFKYQDGTIEEKTLPTVTDITLKDGETVTVKNVPNNTPFSVSEDDYKGEGYTTSITADKGTVQIDGLEASGTLSEEIKLMYTNTKGDIVLSGIAISRQTLYWIITIMALMLLVICIGIAKKKRIV